VTRIDVSDLFDRRRFGCRGAPRLYPASGRFSNDLNDMAGFFGVVRHKLKKYRNQEKYLENGQFLPSRPLSTGCS
jgi:hypothetical protein